MDAEKIAAGLTKAQREALLSGRWDAEMGAILGGLMLTTYLASHDRWCATDLGLRVRAILQREAGDGQ